MTKQKNKKKIPFNVMRKPIVSAILGVTMLAGSVGLLTGCSGEKGDTGATGKSAYELAVENGFVGTVQEWLDSLKGTNGNTPTISISDDGYWVINGEKTDIKAQGEDGDTGATGSTGEKGDKGDKGDAGNGIKNINVVYEYDTSGNLWAIFTITYTESEEPEEIRVLMPAKIEQVYIANQNFFIYDNGKPKMYLLIYYENDTYEQVELTESMITGGNAPIFANAGSYDFQFEYFGKTYSTTINVLTPDAQITSIATNTIYLKKGTSLADAEVFYNVEGVGTVQGQFMEGFISTISIWDDELEDFTEAQSIDSTNVGAEYKITTLLEDTIYIEVYDPEVSNVRYINTSDIEQTADWKDPGFVSSLVGKTVSINYYEPVNGSSIKDVELTAEMIDASDFDINKVGTQVIYITYEGYTEELYISVEPDMSEASLIRTYTSTDSDFIDWYGETFQIYDNGIALIDSYSYVEYDTNELNNGYFVFYDTIMQGNCYFSVTTDSQNSTLGTIGYHIPTGTASKIYSLQKEIMGEPYNIKLEVFGTSGDCFATVYLSDMGNMYYATIKVTYKDANTLTAFGQDYVVGTDLTDITPAE